MKKKLAPKRNPNIKRYKGTVEMTIVADVEFEDEDGMCDDPRVLKAVAEEVFWNDRNYDVIDSDINVHEVSPHPGEVEAGK